MMPPESEPKDTPGWTLGAIRARNLELEAHCQREGCHWFGSLDLDALLASLGPDCPLPEDGPGFPCEKCGGTELKFMLAARPHCTPEDGGGSADGERRGAASTQLASPDGENE